jgi:4-amino-4-deoxy-L-arabinose transferase-like glycosyltransferase
VARQWRPPVEWLLLVPIAIVFVVGTRRELPYVYHADEFQTFNTTVGMLDRHSFDPEFFRYPSLMFYIHLAVLTPFELFGDVIAMERISLGSAHADSPNLVWLLRLVTVAFAVAAVGAAMAIARRVSGGRVASVVTAVVLAVSPLMIEHSRYITTDMYAAAVATAAVGGALLVLRRGRPRDYALAGTFVGLAAGAKYNAVLVAVAVAVAHVLRDCDREAAGAAGRIRSVMRWDRARWLGFAGILALAAFVTSTPHSILSFSDWKADVEFEIHHYSTGHPGAGGSTWTYYFRLLWETYGLLVVVPFFAFVRRFARREAVVIAVWAFGYLGFVARYPLRFDRTILPVLPALAALVGIGAAAIWDWVPRVARRLPPAPVRVAMTLAFVVCASVPWAPARDQLRYLGRDERSEARDWLARIEPGSRVLVSAYAPWVEPARHHVETFNFRARTCRKLDETRACVPMPPDAYAGNFDYLVLAEGEYAKYFRDPDELPGAADAYEQLWDAFPVAARFDQFGYEIVILDVRGDPHS